ncbi:RNA polymerase sigma factor [Aporhodopirellula aestuarii]|uniref:Sigma-70 family RNA polymerase sigma factor n=1 Tax=Aporhodopirellula aestuarii TaxID=2950107 RepID=A0ABT0U0X5_9BACT|nr:sigma-70 family RNA polymerase sigma factor [Aporhodopirellula aestuarii]MCM2370487.1 sigma-70 family RNA polymerase sigma factor [Aporhodopirellula aestuarii]
MNPPTRDEPSTHRSLLDRARDGNDDGWRMLVQVYGPVVYGWIRRCGVQSADAADIMQETFLSASKSLAHFDAERTGATFRGWLWTIAKHKLRDRQRAEAREPAQGNESIEKLAAEQWHLDDADPPSEIDDDLQSVRIRMLELLRTSIQPRTWQMFWRTAVDGCDPGDVADEMNVSRWTVYKARARVLQRLREEMCGFE